MTTSRSDWNPSHHLFTGAPELQPSRSRTTCHVKSPIGDVTWALCTIRWAERCNRNCSTSSTGCVPPALLRGALTIIEMAQAVCLYSPESVKQGEPLQGVHCTLNTGKTKLHTSQTSMQHSPIVHGCLTFSEPILCVQYKSCLYLHPRDEAYVNP